MSQASLPLHDARPAEASDPPRESWWNRLTQINLLQALPLITVVLLLENADDVWYLRTPLIVTCVIGLVYHKLMASTGFWFTVAAMLGATVYLQWDSLDNHKYLFVYWCLGLACAFSLAREHQSDSLALIARLLLGLCMALSVAWKLVTPDFVDGSFFEYCLLVDSRFAHFTEAATDLPREALYHNRHLEATLTQGHLRGAAIDRVTLTSSAEVKSLAWLLTWWTLGIESLIAAAFLLPDSRLASYLRNSVLLAFAVTTYPIATVRGFGWMLMLLGMAQSNQPRDRYFRLGYLAAFLLIEIFTLPLRFIVGG